jgi:2-dehydro-3-deoxy-L-rhamnonate aldolase
VGVDTNLYTRALDKRLAMFKPIAEQAKGKGSY